jgi:hypothetical protein
MHIVVFEATTPRVRVWPVDAKASEEQFTFIETLNQCIDWILAVPPGFNSRRRLRNRIQTDLEVSPG